MEKQLQKNGKPAAQRAQPQGGSTALLLPGISKSLECPGLRGERSPDGLCRYLLVDAHGIQPVVHDVHPAILGGEDKQGHQGLEKGQDSLVSPFSPQRRNSQLLLWPGLLFSHYNAACFLYLHTEQPEIKRIKGEVEGLHPKAVALGQHS